MILIGLILLAVFFLHLYIKILKKLSGSKSEKARRQRFIANLALFVYGFGFLTPLSKSTVILLAYVLLAIVYIMLKRDTKRVC